MKDHRAIGRTLTNDDLGRARGGATQDGPRLLDAGLSDSRTLPEAGAWRPSVPDPLIGTVGDIGLPELAGERLIDTAIADASPVDASPPLEDDAVDVHVPEVPEAPVPEESPEIPVETAPEEDALDDAVEEPAHEPVLDEALEEPIEVTPEVPEPPVVVAEPPVIETTPPVETAPPVVVAEPPVVVDEPPAPPPPVEVAPPPPPPVVVYEEPYVFTPPPPPAYVPPPPSPVGFEIPPPPPPPPYDGFAEMRARDQALLDISMGSPLVLDLDGDGVEVIALEQSKAHFDIDLDGTADHTGWVGPNDGFLVLDRNDNGTIDSRAELFGDMDGASNGFEHLSQLDANGDGRMDASDAAWNDLRVWTDTNGDGRSEATELHTLSEVGVTHVDLKATEVNETVGTQWISHRSEFGREDGSTGRIDDVWFQYEASR